MNLILYHGSNIEFDRLDAEKAGGMIWLTANQQYAAIFGHNIKAYEIKAKRILDVSKLTREYTLRYWKRTLRDLGIDINQIDWRELDWAPDYGKYYFYDLLPHVGNNYLDAGVLEAIKKAGYDAIHTPPEINSGIKSDVTYVVFDDSVLCEMEQG